MANLENVCNWVRTVIEEERAHSGDLNGPARETRLRKLREIELTSRLRHRVGGLNTYMSATGPDIQSDEPDVEIQVKFPGYWHAQLKKPQPASVKDIEKDLSW